MSVFSIATLLLLLSSLVDDFFKEKLMEWAKGLDLLKKVKSEAAAPAEKPKQDTAPKTEVKKTTSKAASKSTPTAAKSKKTDATAAEIEATPPAEPINPADQDLPF